MHKIGSLSANHVKSMSIFGTSLGSKLSIFIRIPEIIDGEVGFDHTHLWRLSRVFKPFQVLFK